MSEILQNQHWRRYLLAREIAGLNKTVISKIRQLLDAMSLLELRSYVKMDAEFDKEVILDSIIENLILILVLLNTFLQLEALAPGEDPVYVPHHSAEIDRKLKSIFHSLKLRLPTDPAEVEDVSEGRPSLFSGSEE